MSFKRGSTVDHLSLLHLCGQDVVLVVQIDLYLIGLLIKEIHVHVHALVPLCQDVYWVNVYHIAGGFFCSRMSP